jgi:hypothetical protein
MELGTWESTKTCLRCAEAETKANRKMRARMACRHELEETMVDDGLEQRSLGWSRVALCWARERKGLAAMVEDVDEDEDVGVGLETRDCRSLLALEMAKLTMMRELARTRARC